MSGTVLVLGASGHFGAAARAAFESAGWVVRIYRRGTDMTAAAQGADVIVNGLNPPNYHAWGRLLPEITATVLAAARSSGATVILPGNVYVFGTEPGPWDENTPHRPNSRKGRIRAELEAAYRAAAGHGVRTILLRAGDFIDGAPADGFFDRIMFSKAARGKIVAAGAPSARHAYAYLPDMARAAVTLAELRGDLAPFEDVPFPGYAVSVDELAGTLANLTGRKVSIGRFPWALIRLSAPFWELGRELLEMRYLFDLPHEIDGTKFDRLLPGFTRTPIERVIADRLADRRQR